MSILLVSFRLFLVCFSPQKQNNHIYKYTTAKITSIAAAAENENVKVFWVVKIYESYMRVLHIQGCILFHTTDILRFIGKVGGFKII